jgi:lysozyme
MRVSCVLTIMFSCLVLTNCQSSSGVDDVLAQRPSQEMTSSVVRPSRSVKRIAMATVPPSPVPQQEILAWAGPVPESAAILPPAPSPVMAAPTERPVPQPAPADPMVKAAPQARMQIYSRRFRDAKPINFGPASPKKLAVHGVDVSRWQGDVDWANLRTQGANFAYIKATDGGDHIDPMFKTNWRKAKEAGLKRGAYHFFYWCRTAGEQADWFIRNVPREPGALPPAIDVEWNGESSCKRRPSRAQVLEKMQVFMDKLEKHYGQRPIIYTAPDFYRDNLRGELADYPFWLRAVAAHPSKVYPGRRWLFWQYSGSGLSHGVSGRIDLNVFHGSEEEWHNWVTARAG